MSLNRQQINQRYHLLIYLSFATEKVQGAIFFHSYKYSTSVFFKIRQSLGRLSTNFGPKQLPSLLKSNTLNMWPPNLGFGEL